MTDQRYKKDTEMKTVIAILLVLVSSVAHAEPFKLLCNWKPLFPLEESFVFYLDEKKVYWVNQDQEGIDLRRVNDGVLEFSAIKSSVSFLKKGATSEYVIKSSEVVSIENIWLAFSINRLSGKMKIVINPEFYEMTRNTILTRYPLLPEENVKNGIEYFNDRKPEKESDFLAVGRGGSWSTIGSCKKVENDYLG